MPGTIQVTVLEFKGVSSSGKSSAKSVKVSMGKTNYQTWDKGEYSLNVINSPLTKLREDLVVSLLDAAGNEIAHTDVKTMHIIEKGSWDEVFSLNGGGHVHLNLRFALNEDERKRIREMRESAMKKKLEKAKPTFDSSETSRGHKKNVPDSTTTIMITEVDSSQAGLFSDSAASFNPIQYHIEVEERDSVVASNVPIEKKSQIPPKKLAATSNVRKMISAFENNQLQEPKQDVKTLKKAQSSPSLSQFKKLRAESIFKEVEDEAIDNRIKISRKLKDDQITVNSHHDTTSKDINESKSRENDSNVEDVTSVSSSSSPEEPSIEKSLRVDTMRRSDSENSSCSGKLIEEAQGKRITSLNRSTTTTNHKAKILEYYKENSCSSWLGYGTWIFPDNHTRPLCITSAGKQVRKILGEAENVRAKKVSKELEKTEKNNDNSSDGGSSNGLIGQVIKVAVIFGFGLLVVFTRQREPRKRKGAEKADLFTNTGYTTLLREEH